MLRLGTSRKVKRHDLKKDDAGAVDETFDPSLYDFHAINGREALIRFVHHKEKGKICFQRKS